MCLRTQVKPRAFDFVCNVRRRWVGTSVVDVFSRVRLGRSGGGQLQRACQEPRAAAAPGAKTRQRMHMRTPNFHTDVPRLPQEFPGRDREYYQQAVADGRLRAEGRGTGALAPDTPLRDGMRLRHLIHLHEPLVPAGPVQVGCVGAVGHGMPGAPCLHLALEVYSLLNCAGTQA